MNPLIGLVYLGCGLLAGTLAGYLGLGGGVVMVPFLTLVTGLDIKEAVPISVTAIAANSIAVSSEYLKQRLVDLGMAARLAVTVVFGFITGSMLINLVPSDSLKVIFAVLLLYTAYNLLFRKNRKNNTQSNQVDHYRPLTPVTLLITYLTGTLAAMLGLGGGVIMVPVLFLSGHSSLARARGTWAFTYGFAAVSALVIYLIHDQLRLEIVAPVVAGILIGGKIGGMFGARAKPTPVKILFIIVIIFSAIKLGWPVAKGWLA